MLDPTPPDRIQSTHAIRQTQSVRDSPWRVRRPAWHHVAHAHRAWMDRLRGCSPPHEDPAWVLCGGLPA